ncbi:MAG TPA: hypothetical protein DCY40_00060 [Actinobacteria bacterium]|nr:hypothetical protein [Actinomycetota bacterium]
MRFRVSLVLRRAIEAAREALTRLDADQVPASLRPVVRASSALTPPLEALLLRELDSLGWLRDKAAAQWGGAEDALVGEGSDRASALFLLRPEGWAPELVRLAWGGGFGSGAAAGDKAAGTAEKAKAEKSELRDKLRQIGRERDELQAEVRRLERAAAEPARSEQQGVARWRARLAETEAGHAEVASAMQARITELEGDAAKLRESVKKERQGRARAEKKLDEHRITPGWVRGGADLARLLDQLAAAAVRVIPENEVVAGRSALRLPEGVRPDGADAVEWVLARSGPKHILVDGYNVGLALAAGKAAEVRARLEPVLGRIRTVARPPRSVTVVYDSSIEASRTGGVAGVAVHFAPPGITADDVIVGMAATAGTVVISNDREVRERSERAGALALWAEALVAWARRRR